MNRVLDRATLVGRPGNSRRGLLRPLRGLRHGPCWCDALVGCSGRLGARRPFAGGVCVFAGPHWGNVFLAAAPTAPVKTPSTAPPMSPPTIGVALASVSSERLVPYLASSMKPTRLLMARITAIGMRLKQAENPTPCAHCRRPLGAQFCECG